MCTHIKYICMYKRVCAWYLLLLVWHRIPLFHIHARAARELKRYFLAQSHASSIMKKSLYYFTVSLSLRCYKSVCARAAFALTLSAVFFSLSHTCLLREGGRRGVASLPYHPKQRGACRGAWWRVEPRPVASSRWENNAFAPVCDATPEGVRCVLYQSDRNFVATFSERFWKIHCCQILQCPICQLQLFTKHSQFILHKAMRLDCKLIN